MPALRAALTKTGLVNRRAIARILSTLLCSLVVTIRPFSSFGGPYPFLILAIKELIFAVQENLAQQLEGTVLNVMGALFAIGISTAAKYLADLPSANTVTARTVPAIFLVFIMFVSESMATFDTPSIDCWPAGWIKSRLPRLQQSMRICCFVSIWLLMMNIGNNPVRTPLHSH